MLRRRSLVLLLAAVLLSGAAPVATQAAVRSSVPSSVPSSAPTSAVVESRSIGTTVEGRNIVAWRLGDPTATRKVVVLAAMHGDETGPSRILYDLRDGAPVRGVDLWVVPTYNRDGVVHHRRQNAHGVDLNRNYPTGWRRQGGSYDSGPRPASEPETRAVMAFLETVRPAYVISFHQPLRGVGRAGAKGSALVRRLHRGLHLPVKSFNCDGACHGTMTEWFNARFPGVAVTVEYGRGVSRTQSDRTGPTGLLQAVGATR